MDINTTENDDLVSKRRARVSLYTSQGLSKAEISEKLREEGFNGTSVAIISKDTLAINNLWLRECLVHADDHRARQFKELTELKRCAWEQNDLKTVLKIIAQEISLLGTSAKNNNIVVPAFRIIDGEVIDPDRPTTREENLRNIANIIEQSVKK